MTWLLRAALTLGMISIALPTAASPIVGRIDTFEVGTTLGWFLPSPTNSNPPVNISTGGPGVAATSSWRSLPSAAVTPPLVCRS